MTGPQEVSMSDFREHIENAKKRGHERKKVKEALREEWESKKTMIRQLFGVATDVLQGAYVSEDKYTVRLCFTRAPPLVYALEVAFNAERREVTIKTTPVDLVEPRGLLGKVEGEPHKVFRSVKELTELAVEDAVCMFAEAVYGE